MPIINHKKITESPWRPNYRKWNITQSNDGTTSSDLSYSEVGVGTGAPLHKHESDELIVVLEGEIEAKLGDKTQLVNKDHTLVIPPNTPHGFKNVGKNKAKILTFFPIQNPFDHTHYLEGSKPNS